MDLNRKILHKDYVTSYETLIAMRVIHPLDREDWIDGCPDPDKGKGVLRSLASLKRGEGWVWSPEIGFGPQLIQFPLFATYDSFAAPTRLESSGAGPPSILRRSRRSSRVWSRRPWPTIRRR
jgi:hypothetical protein